MDNTIFMWLPVSLFILLFIHTECNVYVFPLSVSTVNENMPAILFINEGETDGVANVSIPNVSTMESVEVTAHTTFTLYDVLRKSNIEPDTVVTIFIRTSESIRPYVSLENSHPSIAIQHVGKDYYMYDTKGYNVNLYCMNIFSLENNTQVKITKYINQAGINSTRPISNDITLDEFETNRVCITSEIQGAQVVSTNSVVLTSNDDYKTTGTQSIIDMLVAYSYWGKTFTVYPILHQQHHRTFVRIFSAKSNNTVYYQKNKHITIPAGDYVDVEIIEPLTLVASTPVFVTLSAFEKSSFYNIPHDVAVTDPIVNIHVIPSEQYISKTYIQSPTASSTSKGMISTKCDWLSQITFDDEVLNTKQDAEISTIKDSKYCLVTVPIKSETTHEVRSHLRSATFTVMVNVTDLNTTYLYNVGGLDKPLNCKTLIYGKQFFEHECDVQVYEKNISCSGPPLTCDVDQSKCSFCLRRIYELIVLAVGSVLITIAINVFCQVCYCPRRERMNSIKRAKEKMKEKEEQEARNERKRAKNEEIRLDRILKRTALLNVNKPTFYNLIGRLKENAEIQ